MPIDIYACPRRTSGRTQLHVFPVSDNRCQETAILRASAEPITMRLVRMFVRGVRGMRPYGGYKTQG